MAKRMDGGMEAVKLFWKCVADSSSMSGNVPLCQEGKRYRTLHNFYNGCRGI